MKYRTPGDAAVLIVILTVAEGVHSAAFSIVYSYWPLSAP